MIGNYEYLPLGRSLVDLFILKPAKCRKESVKKCMTNELTQHLAQNVHLVLGTKVKIQKSANKRQQQVCIPVGYAPPACCPYLPAYTAQGVSAPRRGSATPPL